MRKRDSQIRAMVTETSEKTVKAALALSTSKPIGEIFSVEAIVSEGLNLGGLFISVYSQIILDAKPYGLRLVKMAGPTCDFIREEA